MSGNRFFTSDLHLGHRLVSEIRGFENVVDHDESIIEQWNKQVKPKDTVWILGDIAVVRVPEALEVIKSLPGTKHLISGNHDPVASLHTTRMPYWHRKFRDVFETVQDFRKMKISGFDVLMSHYPYPEYGDRALPRRAEEHLRHDHALRRPYRP